MKQKILVLSSLVLVIGLVSSAAFAKAESSEESEANWMIDFTAAKAKAESEEKPMLLNFTGSDWCGWCIKLDKEVFSKKAFKDYAAENFVLVELDFPRGKEQSAEIEKQNEALAKKYGVRGFPTIIILNSEGELIDGTGYRRGGAEKYVEHLKEIVSGAE